MISCDKIKMPNKRQDQKGHELNNATHNGAENRQLKINIHA